MYYYGALREIQQHFNDVVKQQALIINELGKENEMLKEENKNLTKQRFEEYNLKEKYIEKEKLWEKLREL